MLYSPLQNWLRPDPHFIKRSFVLEFARPHVTSPLIVPSNLSRLREASSSCYQPLIIAGTFDTTSTPRGPEIMTGPKSSTIRLHELSVPGQERNMRKFGANFLLSPPLPELNCLSELRLPLTTLKMGLQVFQKI